MITIKRFDPSRSSQQLLQSVAALHSEVENEIRPDYAPPPVEEYIALWQNQSKYRASLYWVAQRSSGEVLGCSNLAFKRVSENSASARINVMVSKHWRRQKIGTFLLMPLVSVARANSRENFTITVKKLTDGVGFLKKLDAQPKAQTIESHLYITDEVKQHLLGILNKHHNLSELCALLWWQNKCPEYQIKDFAEGKMWMNTAPRGDRRKENWIISPEWIYEEESNRLKSGISWWTIAAVEKAAGRIIGFSDVHFSAYRPQIAMQEDTAVNPEYRRKGVASWLKLHLILKIFTELKNIHLVTTVNGSDNYSILNLNKNIGFVPKYSLEKWELRLDQLIKALAPVTDLLKQNHFSTRFIFEESN